MYQRILNCCDRLRIDFDNKQIRNELQTLINDVTYEQTCREEIFILICSSLILLIDENNVNKNIINNLRNAIQQLTDPDTNYIFMITLIRYLKNVKSLTNVEIHFIFEYINKMFVKYVNNEHIYMISHVVLYMLLYNKDVMTDIKEHIKYDLLIVDIVRDIIPKLDPLYQVIDKLKELIGEQIDDDINILDFENELAASE